MLDADTEREIDQRAHTFLWSVPCEITDRIKMQREAILADRARIAAKIVALEREGYFTHRSGIAVLLAAVNGGSR